MTLRQSPINISKCKIARCALAHDKKLVWKKPKDGTRGLQSNSFYFRTLQNWNDLPRSAAHAKTINEFKNELDDAWMEKPFKFNHETTTQSGS